ncbi:MAG: molybdenum cofactor guanylyltransferase [Nitrospinae bacterium]|nr:molybdenum cofactor guanylyltransferase [Nitrospinota bacterium]
MNPAATTRLPFSAAVLAGGQSRRMGRDKSMLEIGGVPIIRRIADTLGEMFTEVFVVANEKEEFERMGLAVVGDIHPGNDSLGGLHTAVASAQASHVFVAGCDMPLLRPALIRGLASLVEAWDVVIPVKDDYPEPLCAFYGKACAPHIEESISGGRLKMIGFHELVRVRRVEETTWRAWDPEGASFLNANTPEEFEKIKAISMRGEAK